ncbi:hypothetical protein [Legionella fairfieldensis]|nr:hypothetical protein [Legionella fairfieldensis]
MQLSLSGSLQIKKKKRKKTQVPVAWIKSSNNASLIKVTAPHEVGAE